MRGRASITRSIPLFGDSSPNVSSTALPSVPVESLYKFGISKRQVRYAMRNQVDLFLRNMEHFLHNPQGVLAHDNEAIRQAQRSLP